MPRLTTHSTGARIALPSCARLCCNRGSPQPRECRAFYTAHVQPQSIAEFLLLNAECPRSVRFSVESVQAALQAISKLTGVRKAGRAERLAGRLSASLEYGQVDEIIADNLGAFLADIQGRCNQLHTAIHQTYIAYQIDTALAS